MVCEFIMYPMAFVGLFVTQVLVLTLVGVAVVRHLRSTLEVR